MAYFDPSTGILQGASNGITLQGSSPTLQASSGSGLSVQPASTGGVHLLQPTTAPSYNQTLGGGAPRGLTSTSVTPSDPAADAAAAKAAEDAAKAAVLRTNITQLVNGIKDIFNARYGQVDSSAGEQVGKLNDRFGNESTDLTGQITAENQKVGAAHAASGSYDSSYRGNNVDTVTHAGEAQIRDLGTELAENINKIGQWVSQQKVGFDAQKSGVDAIASHLSEETDPGRLTDLRNTLDSRIAELHAQSADNNTSAQNAAALSSIAPSSARAVQLKTTLSQIIAGSADPGVKSAIGNRLIANSGLTPDEQEKLSMAFQGDLSGTTDPNQQQQPAAA